MAAVNFRLRKPTNPDGSQKTEPVSIQVWYYHSGVEVELATGIKVLPSQWNGNRVTNHPKSNRINKVLSELESSLFNVHIDHRNKSKSEHEAIVRTLIKGESKPTEEKKTVVQAVRLFIAQYEREKEPGTVKRYKGLLKKLVGFEGDSLHGGGPLLFEHLDHNFYDAFKKFLHGHRNPNYSNHHLEYNNSYNCYLVCPGDDLRSTVGLFDEVVFKYFINLKTVCAWAEKRGYQVSPIYKEWEIIKREYAPISLTLEELKRIEEIPLPKHLDIARDFLSLESRTGQRISDLRRFARPDITGNVWTFTQKKGNRLSTKTIRLPLVGYCAPALLILQKYNYELPKISEQHLNRSIKTVCQKAGITQSFFIERWAGNKKIRIPGEKWEFISSHTGRKTAITLMLQAGIPVKVVMDITGIRSYKTLRHYDGQSEIGTIETWLNKMDSGVLMKKAN